VVDFLHRMKQRKLVQWALAYLAGAWVLLQVLGLAVDSYHWSDALMRLAFAVLALGLVVALVLAWYHGERGEQKVTGPELLLIALVLAVGGGLLWRFAWVPEASVAPSGTTAAPSAPQASVAAPAPPASIAVLPFESLSGDKSNAYFVSGMQDMILTSLSKLDGLKVISRTSTERYASRPENLKQVGAELGVAHILEGSVQRAGDRVLINLQLIDARTDAHLWAESYERDVADVFSVEREVAGAVATALRARLVPGQVAAMGRAPTASPAAYDLFLRGEYETRKFIGSSDDADIRDAIAHYEGAVAADPRFALAFARLARARLLLYWSGNDTVPDAGMAAAAREAAAHAKQLMPGLPEAGLAMADVEYRLDLDFAGALASYDAVLAQRPQSADALSGKAQALRRLGRYEDSIAAFSAAMTVDPRDSAPVTDRGITRFLAGDLRAAESDLRRAIALNPSDDYAAGNLSMLLLYRDGEPDAARAVLQGRSQLTSITRMQTLVCQRRFDAALATLGQPEAGVGSDLALTVGKAQILAYMGKAREARQLLLPDMAGFRRQLGALPVNSGGGQVPRFALAMGEALLGDDTQALRLAQQGLSLVPPEKDLANGSLGLGHAARVYAMLGRGDLLLPMLARIRALEGTDTMTSAANLRLDPVWDKVRADPRFQAEIDRFAAKQAALAARYEPK
jgi:TolB-like protein/Flp pilus assembly protein TadD